MSFFRRIISIVLAAICFGVFAYSGAANAGIATVGAVHDYVREKWDIEIPYAPATAGNIPNMRYIMQLVDRANEILNEYPISNYANNTKYATSKIAADTAARDAVDTLIKKMDIHFFFTPATTSTTYSFQISAVGTFNILWGDGQTQTIEKTDTENQTISHTYASSANKYEIALGGKATAYNTGNVAAISFQDAAARLKSIRGCLGCVFSTIDDETVAADMRQPRFYDTFYYNTSLNSVIPEELFSGIHGAPVSYMFGRVFMGAAFTGSIPENLFAGIQGAPAPWMFFATFQSCNKLSGGIPEKLFAGIDGEPAEGMFFQTFAMNSGISGEIPGGLFAGVKGPPAYSMFAGCFRQSPKLTGVIPGNLFAGIKGAPAEEMFNATFYYATGLTGIGEGLFDGINGYAAKNMFTNTFHGSKNLSGPSATSDGICLYQKWSDSLSGGTYRDCVNLSDRDCIPTGWGGGGTKPVGTCEPVVEEGAASGDGGD